VTTPQQAPPGPAVVGPAGAPVAGPAVGGPPVAGPPVAGPGPGVAGPGAAGPAVSPVASYSGLFGLPVTVLNQIGAVAVPGEVDRNQLRVLLALPAPTADEMGEATRLSTRLRLCAAPAPAAEKAEKAEKSAEERSAATRAQQYEQDLLGRVPYRRPIPALTALTARPRSKKDEVSAKAAGDHVFNDPFQAVAKVLTDEHPVVAAAQRRIQQLADEWSAIRDALRASEVPSRDGVSDSNSCAFGLYNKQLQALVTASDPPTTLPALMSVLDGMFVYGLVDDAAYAEVSEKHALKLWQAEQFLAEHRADLDRALRTLLKVRRDADPYLELLRTAAARYASTLATGQKPTKSDAADLRELRALLGPVLFEQEMAKLLERTALFQASTTKPNAGHVNTIREVAAGTPAGLNLAGQAALLPGAPALILHDSGHFHLLLPLGNGTVIDLDVQPDGNCLAHAACWADLLLDNWSNWVTQQHGGVKLDRARDWLARAVAQHQAAEQAAAIALRQQIGNRLLARRPWLAGVVVESLANLIGTAHVVNIDNGDPSSWHFPEAGTMLAPVLAAFCRAHRAGVLDWDTDLTALLAQDPMIIDAYIEAITSDPGMWLGPLEVRVLKKLRAEAGAQVRPIQLCLAAQAPEVVAMVDVCALTRRPPALGKQGVSKPGSKPPKPAAKGAKQALVPSGGGELLALPRWEFPQLDKVCYLQDDIAGIFIEAGWEQGLQSAHVFICPTIQPPLELHASLTQKPPILAPYVTQVEFVLLPKTGAGEQRDRSQGARFWYLIRRHTASGAVRLEFQGNVSATEKTGDEARQQAVKQMQSDENERAYTRYLLGAGADPSAAITAMIEALQAALSKWQPRNPTRK
jgi:hypothetical protein